MATTTCYNDSTARVADRSPLAALAERLERVAAWQRERRVRKELARLPEHLLHDIGFTQAATGPGQLHEARPMYRPELFGDHLYHMIRENRR